jgi:hypothetical protein
MFGVVVIHPEHEPSPAIHGAMKNPYQIASSTKQIMAAVKIAI